MKYLLNVTDMGITEKDIDSWYDAFLNAEGMYRPRDGGKPKGPEGESEWHKAIDAVYDPNGCYFQMFDETNSPIEIPTFHKCGRAVPRIILQVTLYEEE